MLEKISLFLLNDYLFKTLFQSHSWHMNKIHSVKLQSIHLIIQYIHVSLINK